MCENHEQDGEAKKCFKRQRGNGAEIQSVREGEREREADLTVVTVFAR